VRILRKFSQIDLKTHPNASLEKKNFRPSGSGSVDVFNIHFAMRCVVASSPKKISIEKKKYN